MREFELKKHIMNPTGLGKNAICIYSPIRERDKAKRV